MRSLRCACGPATFRSPSNNSNGNTFDHQGRQISCEHRGRRVTRCNRAFEQLFGYDPGELDGQLSRAWYLNDEDWKAAGDLCYAPLSRGDAFHACEFIMDYLKTEAPFWKKEQGSEGERWVVVGCWWCLQAFPCCK